MDTIETLKSILKGYELDPEQKIALELAIYRLNQEKERSFRRAKELEEAHRLEEIRTLRRYPWNR